MKFIYLKIMLTLGLFIAGTQALGQSFSGTIVTTTGDVKILKKAKASDKGPFALYEGVKYKYKRARIGQKVKASQVVQCGPKGKAKLVYKNGDHIIVSEGTSLLMPHISSKGGNKKKSEMNLFYGKVRALVSKKGPRNQMQVKTKSAVAGVRGTDFFIASNAKGTDLTVLRGQVDVAKVEKNKVVSKPVKVKTGFTAKIEQKKPTTTTTKKASATNNTMKSLNEVKLVSVTKEKLIEVQKESTIKPTETVKADLAEEVKKEIEQLQEKSTQAVIEDIKEEDPKLYEKLKEQKNVEATEIHTQVVSKLYKEAPSEPEKRKLTNEEIDQLGEGIYEKYFKAD